MTANRYVFKNMKSKVVVKGVGVGVEDVELSTAANLKPIGYSSKKRGSRCHGRHERCSN
jgi:hypothetical protein